MKLMQAIGGAGHGGAENFFVHLTQAFQRSGLDQHVVTRSHPVRDAALKEAGVSFENLKFGGALDLVTPYRLKQISKRYKPDVYLSWMSRAASMTPSGPFPKLARLGGYYNLKYFQRCDHLVGVTPDLCDYIVRQGWPAAQVHHIPNFLTYHPKPALNRADFDTPNDAPLLLLLGRLHPVKGIDTAIKALKNVPDAYLWIAGEGPLKAELEALTAELKLTDRVRFLGWRTDKEALLATADITVFPSRQEGFGNVILESWASNTPMVATRAEGPVSLIEQGKTGLLSDIDDVDALSANLYLILNDKSLYAEIQVNGQNEFKSRYTENRAVQNWRELFNLVTGQ
ncbi:glycosyltransferase [Sneathiella limimaris]|uniref:glycosyltransferase n=1 Tax=Sneathiella limimaris TaxID=1964213 RepID=UPI00146EC1C6|nr:glycosyltransferase [Sneathiella limimaris]